jgi:hypothetical protein
VKGDCGSSNVSGHEQKWDGLEVNENKVASAASVNMSQRDGPVSERDAPWLQMRPVSSPFIRVGPTVRIAQADDQVFDTTVHVQLTHAVGPVWTPPNSPDEIGVQQEEQSYKGRNGEQVNQLEMLVFCPRLQKLVLCRTLTRRRGSVAATVPLCGGEVWVTPVLLLNKHVEVENGSPNTKSIVVPRSIRRRFLLRFAAYRPRCGIVADASVLVRIWLCFQTPEQMQLMEELELANRRWGSVRCGPLEPHENASDVVDIVRTQNTTHVPCIRALAVGLNEVLTLEMDGLYAQTRWLGGG